MKRLTLMLAVVLLIALLVPFGYASPIMASELSEVSTEGNQQAPLIPDGAARAVLIYYGGYDDEIYSRIRQICPALLVTSTPHDYWRSEYSLKDIAGLQSLGIKVFGFTTASYETLDTLSDGRSQEDCIRDILEKDGTDGVFVDECSGYLNEEKIRYHKKYAGIVHSYGKLYYANPGMNDLDERWFTEVGADFVNCSEHWYTPGYPNTVYNLSPVQMKYAGKCTVLSFPKDNITDAYTAIMRAYEQGIAYAYANDNFFLTVAPYWRELADRLRDQPETPPVAGSDETRRDKITLSQVSIGEVGWVVLYRMGNNGEPDLSSVVGKMYPYPGTHFNVEVEITGSISPGDTVCTVLHLDNPGDQVFSYGTGNDDPLIKENGRAVTDCSVFTPAP